MRNLKTLQQKLPNNVILSKKDLLNTIGGRRYETKSYNNAVSLCQQLSYYGYSPSMAQHDGKYCIEW